MSIHYVRMEAVVNSIVGNARTLFDSAVFVQPRELSHTGKLLSRLLINAELLHNAGAIKDVERFNVLRAQIEDALESYLNPVGMRLFDDLCADWELTQLYTELSLFLESSEFAEYVSNVNIRVRRSAAEFRRVAVKLLRRRNGRKRRGRCVVSGDVEAEHNDEKLWPLLMVFKNN